MKDILLVNPPENYKNTWGIISKFADRVPPLNLLFLLSYVNAHQFKADIIDCNVERDPVEALLKKLREESYSYIGFTVSTPLAHSVYALSAKVKEMYPSIIQIAGGVHPTFIPDDVFNNARFDYIIKGEGEVTLLEILQNKKLSEIDGLSYRGDNGIVHNNDRELLTNLDLLPLPEYERFPLEKYFPKPDLFRRFPVMTLMTSRGCPFRCTFCVGNLMFGKRLRAQSYERVVEECTLAVERFQAKQIRFIDDNFTLNNKRIENLCREIIKRKLNRKFVWSCSSRVDSINEDLLAIMKEAGCFLIFFGVESGNEEILKSTQKKINKDQIVKAFRLMKKHNIESRASFILGLPGETKETVLETIDFAKEIDPDYASFSIAIPYPGTELYDVASRANLIHSNDWNSYVQTVGFTDSKLAYCPDHISEQELKELQKYAFKSFYFRKTAIYNKFRALLKSRDISRYFYLAKRIILD